MSAHDKKLKLFIADCGRKGHGINMSISFPGAVKYKKNNGFSLSQPIKKPLPSPIYIYNLKQGKNITLKPTVKKGEYILGGQKIADLDTLEALPVFSAVSGTVSSLNDTSIVIENDMLSRFVPRQKFDKPMNELTSRELLWIIRENGICESRTGTPVHVMLSPDTVPDCVIVCCFDSDPFVSSPQMAALNNTEKILKGLDIVLNLLCTKKAIVAVENDTKKIFSDFKYHLRYNEDISLYSLKARYPQSCEDILIKTLTGKSSDSVNIPIFSPETLCAVADVFQSGRAVTTKIVTVSGDDILSPCNYSVPIGTPISSLLSDSGYTSPKLVIQGGVLDGTPVTDLDEPVTISTTAITAFNDTNNILKYRKELV